MYLESRYVIGCVYIYIHVHVVYTCMNLCTMNVHVHVLCTLCSNTVCADIALLVLEKCTEEKNDRDDANFEMLFDYEFVEDFCVDRDKSPRQLSSQRRTGTTNALISGSGGGSVESLPGTGKGEEGKKAEVELKEVRVVAGDEDQEAKVVGKRSAAENTSHSPTSDTPLMNYRELSVHNILHQCLHAGLSPTRGSSFFLRKVTALSVLLCLVCLFYLAYYFLPSHLSLKHVLNC